MTVTSIFTCFELLGIEPPEFLDDRGPDQVACESCFATDEDCAEAFTGTANSIGRAEVMVGALLDAATELASIINGFKRGELVKRLQEIEADSLADPAERKAAITAAMHFSKLQEELGKNVRRTLPQWQVKGV